MGKNKNYYQELEFFLSKWKDDGTLLNETVRVTSVEVFEHVHIDEEGVQHKHRHKYIGDYPNGYKTSNTTPERDIKYLNSTYTDFKTQLIEYAKNYFPNTHTDFSEASPGMMFIEMAAYVGDILSFYQNTQLQENFLLLAQEKENLYNMAYYNNKKWTTSRRRQ